MLCSDEVEIVVEFLLDMDVYFEVDDECFFD